MALAAAGGRGGCEVQLTRPATITPLNHNRIHLCWLIILCSPFKLNTQKDFIFSLTVRLSDNIDATKG